MLLQYKVPLICIYHYSLKGIFYEIYNLEFHHLTKHVINEENKSIPNKVKYYRLTRPIPVAKP